MVLVYLCVMNLNKKIILILLLLINTVLLFGQKKDSADNIIIYGDSFLFSIHEPLGWKGDVENAKSHNANIIFYKQTENVKKGGTFVQVLTYKKQDEEVNKDLEYETNNMKEKNHDLKIQIVEANNKNQYACFAKLIYVENLFYLYTAYINPGNKFHNAFAISMKVEKHPATKEEIAGFKEIISTLIIFKR